MIESSFKFPFSILFSEHCYVVFHFISFIISDLCHDAIKDNETLAAQFVGFIVLKLAMHYI